MKAFIYIIFFLLFITGCSNSNIEKQIVEEIESKCAKKVCTIDINQLTSFSWDKMYVFGPGLTEDRIKEIIGIDYPAYVEFTRPIIFIKQSKIVHFENDYIDEEYFTDGQVIFDYPDSVHYQTYFSGKAIFKGKIKKIDGGRYFILSQPGTK
jgi:hypothetical protein